MKDHEMPSQLSKDLMTDLQEHAKNNSKPAWFSALDRFGLPVVGWVFVGFVIWHWGGKWLDVKLETEQQQQAETSAFLQAQISATETQTRAIEKLAEAARVERDFETRVMAVHDEQTKTLKEMAAQTKATSEQLLQCKERMKHSPEMRAEEVSLLKEIRDGLRTAGGG